MLELVVVLPLAQLNASSGGGATTTAAPAPVIAPTPEAATQAAVSTNTNAVVGSTSAPAASTSAPGTNTSQPASPPSFLGQFGAFLPMIVILGGLYFFMTRGQRKEEKRRKSLMSELKKGDRVMTIGGMLAKVVSVDGDEVVLKVDEAANVKATYRKTAIQEVIDRDDKK